MLDFLTPYWILTFVLPPALFISWNSWNLSRLTHKVVLDWRRKEAHFLKEWSLVTRDNAEEELGTHIRRNLQSSSFLFSVVLLNLLVIILAFKFLEISLLSNVVWLFTLLLMHFHLEKQVEKVMKDGIPYYQMVHHNRIKKMLSIGAEFKGSIAYPYLFTKSYQRSLAIEIEFSEAIRSSSSPEEGKMLISLLAKEEENLMQDMKNALMGRIPRKPEASENTEAISTLLSHAQDLSLPTEARYKAMNLASELQKKQ